MIRTEVRDGAFLWITIDQPDALNAMDPESMAALAETWDRYRDDDELLVAVVTGAGERSFTVGSNLKTFVPRLQSGEMDPRENEGAYMKGAIGPVFKPVLAAVNGDCLGGGTELLTCTDIRVAVPHARFGLPEARWAVFPGGGGTTRLPRQIGYARAMDILLTGRMLDAEEAKEVGLINEIVEPARLEERVTEIAEEIAGNGTLAVRKIKESAWRQMDLPLAEAYELESELGLEVFHHDQAKEGMAAFVERREPSFRRG
ncbi:MAG: enoyl-CoA hydratase/isomerase family protein [Solirubrobacterales bacterium]|nr:enoyl-CoA hydratase/isomerase family protein [Solirubrobacterales bacterium]